MSAALGGALAVALTTLLVALAPGTAEPQPRQQAGWLGGLYAGLTLAVCERVWSQAIIVEVYALHLFWLALCALLFQLWIATGRGFLLAAASYSFGLGLGTHLTLGLLLPAAIIAWASGLERRRLAWRQWPLALGALSAGAAVYGFLPLWAARQAVPSWGDPGSLRGFWQHISAEEYRYLLGVVPWQQRLERLSYAARDLLHQPGPIGAGLALGWGLAFGWREARALLVLSAGLALSSLIFAIGYGGADGSVYLLPWTWAWCVWAGLGIEALLRQFHPIRLVSMFALPLALGPGWMLATQYQRLDLHRETAERERVMVLLRALPTSALLFTDDDADTFGVWYAQRALAVRPDVQVIDTRLLRRSWYRAQLGRQLGTEAICQALQTNVRPRFRLDGGMPVPIPPDTALCEVD